MGVHLFLWAASMMLVAGPALAAWPDGGMPSLVEVPSLLALLAGAAGMAPVALWLRSRARRAATKAEARAAEAARLEEVLAVTPDGYYLWEADGGERCSRRLAVTLDLFGGTEATFQEMRDCFRPSEAAALDAAVKELRAEGVGFDLELMLRNGYRRVLVMGVRAAAADGRALADVLWVRDVTEEAAAVDRLSHATSDLAAERDRLRALLDALPYPVWLRDAHLSLVYCNSRYAEAADAASPAEAVEHGGELVGSASVREARALAARARAAGIPRSESFRLVVGGARRLVEITEVPVPEGPSRTVLLTAGYAVDNTREEELAAELARHVEAHGAVLEKLGTAIAIFAADARLGFHNTAFRRLWHLEEEWLDSRPTYGDLLDMLRDRRLLPEVADYRAFREEELRRFTSLIEPLEDLLHLPDETTLRRIVSPHPFGGLLFTYEDVTDALVLERSYNTSVAVQRETLDNLHEGVAVFGGDGRLRLSNPAFAGIWHLPAEFLAGEPHVTELVARHASFFGDADWPAVNAKLLALVREREASQGRLDRSDGSILTYASVPLPDGNVLTTWLDVTDSAQVERALRERNEALRAADRLKSDFIANVSCEVRAPLTTIGGFAEVLTGEYYGKLNKRQAEYAQGIAAAAAALHALVADILDLAAVEAGQMTLHLKAFDVHSMLANVLSLTRERMREKSLHLHFDCPPDIGWMVGDERRLKQVLFNLLSNSVKFTPAGGSVTLAAQRAGGMIVLTVADTGIGIPAPEQEAVFKGFRRGSHPEARQNGAGLGLSLVKSFVELHGGRVELVSVPGEGTTVTCTVPAGEADSPAEGGI